MSGGAWEYVFHHFNEAAERLSADKDPLRKLLGQRMALVAKAVHDVEWVDSGDLSPGEDHPSICAALGMEDADIQARTLSIELDWLSSRLESIRQTVGLMAEAQEADGVTRHRQAGSRRMKGHMA